MNRMYEFSIEKILDEDLEEFSSHLIICPDRREDTNESDVRSPS